MDHFLSAPTRREMAELANSDRWLPSTVGSSVRQASNEAFTAIGRSSSTLMAREVGPWLTERLHRIEQSLNEFAGIAPANLEPWQVTRYRRGEEFDYHCDCGCWRKHPSGERKRTIMVYLQKPTRGGATHFRVLDLTVRPLVGRLVVGNNLMSNGNCDHAMVRSGLQVWRGHRITLTTWEHESRFICK